MKKENEVMFMFKKWKSVIAMFLMLPLLLSTVVNVSAVTSPLFSQDFSVDENLDAWSSTSNQWKIVESGDEKYLTHPGNCNTIISTGDASWTDYTYSADVVITGTLASPGLLFRYQNDNNFYMFLYTPTEGLLRLYKRVNGTFTVLKDVSKSLQLNKAYQFEVKVHGDEIICYVDNEMILTCTDSTFSTGKIGVRIVSGNASATAYIGNPTVSSDTSEPEDEQILFSETFDTLDTTVWGNGQGGDFFLKEVNGDNWLASRSDGIISAGDLTWTDYEVIANVQMTGSGDWNAPGLLFRYQDANNFYMFMYSNYSADKAARLYKRINGSFQLIAEKSYNLSKDTTIEYKVHVFGNTITCYINDKMVLQKTDAQFANGKIGFRSYVNNQPNTYAMIDDISVKKVAEAAEIPEELPDGATFYDTFTNGLTKWTAGVGSFEKEMADGENAVAKPAASAISTLYTGAETWNGYRLEATLSATSGEMGLITHYTDADNYYLATIDYADSTVMLYKGTSLLATKAWRLGEETRLAITVNGQKVSVWVDESKMIDYLDSTALTAGKIGLYAKDADGSFDNVGTFEMGVKDTLPGDYAYDQTPKALTQAPEIRNGIFYVAENGNDTWSGLLDRPNGDLTDGPFATLKKASQAVAAAKIETPNQDYTVMLRSGTYYLDETLELTSANGGSGNYRVTYSAYPGETPVVSGGREVTTQWSTAQDGIWKTTLPAEFDAVDIRQLFVEDQRATRSCEPDNGYWTIAAVDTANYSWIRPNGDIPEAWEGLTGVEMNSRGIWHYNRQSVASFDAATDTVVSNLYIGVQASGVKISANVSSWAGADWLYFENALMFVDTPGEWFYDETTRELYYYPENSADPNELDIVIPYLEMLIEATGTRENPVENLDIYGVSFCHTTWSMPADVERRGIQGGFWGNTRTDPVYAPPAAISYENVIGSRIQNCLFSMMGEGAIAFGAGANGNLIYGCEFDDVGANCIQVGYRNTYVGIGHPLEREWDDDMDSPRGNQIINNFIHDCCTVDQGSVGIWVGYANHTLIEHNTIKNMPYSGINVGWRWNAGITSSHHNKILWNYVDTVMMTVADGGGIYCVGEQYGNKVLYNYVNNSDGTGIYFDEKTNYTEAAYNHTTNIKLAGFNTNANLTENNYHDHYNSAPEDVSLFGCSEDYGVNLR